MNEVHLTATKSILKLVTERQKTITSNPIFCIKEFLHYQHDYRIQKLYTIAAKSPRVFLGKLMNTSCATQHEVSGFYYW